MYFINCAQLEEMSLASFVRILDYQKMKIFSKLLKYLISEACNNSFCKFLLFLLL